MAGAATAPATTAARGALGVAQLEALKVRGLGAGGSHGQLASLARLGPLGLHLGSLPGLDQRVTNEKKNEKKKKEETKEKRCLQAGSSANLDHNVGQGNGLEVDRLASNAIDRRRTINQRASA